MSVTGLGEIFSFGQSVIERLWPDANKRAEEMRKLEELKQAGDLARLDAHVNLLLGQLRINEQEAKHKSIFVAGWRPAVGWLCVFVMAFNYVGVYLLEFILALSESTVSAPDRFDMSELWPVLVGMLGIGGMRSFDKAKGTHTDRIK